MLQRMILLKLTYEKESNDSMSYIHSSWFRSRLSWFLSRTVCVSFYPLLAKCHDIYVEWHDSSLRTFRIVCASISYGNSSRIEWLVDSTIFWWIGEVTWSTFAFDLDIEPCRRLPRLKGLHLIEWPWASRFSLSRTMFSPDAFIYISIFSFLLELRFGLRDPRILVY